MPATLDTYRLLGRSGLRVSPLALGTATFGTEWGWGAERDDARRLFDTYVDRGGNFIDTAPTYTDGTSERLVGEFAQGRRDRLVLATKYTTLRRQSDPNSGGSQRKNLIGSVEASLRALGTDYLDLLYLHVWDFVTPIDEILRGMDDLVRQGKVLYVAMSTAPAWQIARMQTLADLRGWSPLVALQIEYNLVQRGGESDLIPMARELGLGVVPFSPLAGGVLTGKYSSSDLTPDAGGSDHSADSPGGRRSLNLSLGSLSERSLGIADAVGDVATELGCTPGQVALAWLMQNPRVTAPIIGARTTSQLDENLAALDVALSADQLQRLDDVSAVEPAFPHGILASDHLARETHGDMTIEARR